METLEPEMLPHCRVFLTLAVSRLDMCLEFFE